MTTFADTGLRYATPLTVNNRERLVRSETLNLKTQAVSNDAQRWDITATLEPAVERDPGAGLDLVIHKNTHGLSTSFTTKMPQYPGTQASNPNANLRTEPIDLDWGDENTEDDPADQTHRWLATTRYSRGDVAFVFADHLTQIPINPSGIVGAYVALEETLNARPDLPSSNNEWELIYNGTDSEELSGRAGDEWVAFKSDALVTVNRGRFVMFENHTKIYQVTHGIDASLDTLVAFKVYPPLREEVYDEVVIVHDDPDINVFYAQDGQEGITYTDGIIVRATVSLVENLQ